MTVEQFAPIAAAIALALIVLLIVIILLILSQFVDPPSLREFREIQPTQDWVIYSETVPDHEESEETPARMTKLEWHKRIDAVGAQVRAERWVDSLEEKK